MASWSFEGVALTFEGAIGPAPVVNDSWSMPRMVPSISSDVMVAT